MNAATFEKPTYTDHLREAVSHSIIEQTGETPVQINEQVAEKMSEGDQQELSDLRLLLTNY